MSGLHEVDCSGCGRRHVTNGEQARKQRVLRCDCGHFVRLDRALSERRSENTPPPVEIASARTVEEEDPTRLHLASSAVAALNGTGRSRSAQPSLVDDERLARAASRDSALNSRPSSPAPARQRQASLAPTDKPLWYVDLGGTELVQMTIEQLILARRGGKLGEGALVWREGMASWRPVGTLIPAASASTHPAPSAAPAPTQPPAAVATRTPFPIRTPLPRARASANPAPEAPAPQSLASYERPMATLEFAFEKHERTPLLGPTRASLPSIDSAGALSRPKTPLPRASLSGALSTPFPRAAQLPRVGSFGFPGPPSSPRISPPPPPPPVPSASVAPAALPSASPSPIPEAPAPTSSHAPSPHLLASLHLPESLSERPRWVSACIALVVCVTASAAGASLVHSLKQRPKSQVSAAATTLAPTANAPSVQAVSNLAAAKPASPSSAAAPSSAPLVVTLESLSVERKRAPTHVVRAVAKPEAARHSENSEETPAANESAPEPVAPETATSSDAPAAARPNPYGSGSLIDQIKKATEEEEAAK
ncbi:MAG TPA: DUF4339 domain-containing protein [Polyangiaceae bacterium]|nr:DUF4339 domain-containing protein [Polyangiaceae bacterium]